MAAESFARLSDLRTASKALAWPLDSVRTWVEIFDRLSDPLQISDTVYPMYKAYIEPDLKTAHLRIYNTFNPFAGFMHATYILKSDQAVSQEVIRACLKVSIPTYTPHNALVRHPHVT